MSLLKRDSSATLGARNYNGGAGRAAMLPRAVIALELTEDSEGDEVAQLRALLSRYDMERATAQDAQEAAVEMAYERGRAQGLNEATSREETRLAALVTGLDAMLGAVQSEIRSASDIAIDIAQAALDRILGDSGHYAALVAETAQHHAATLLQGTLVRLLVSAADFPDEAVLAGLSQFGNGVAVQTDPALEPGTCRFKLTLGELDISIPAQAAAVRQILVQSRQGAR